MSDRSERDADKGLEGAMGAVLWLWLVFIFALVIPALFLVSVFLSKFLLSGADKAADGSLLRNEGPALLVTAAFWGLISSVLLPWTIGAGWEPGRSLPVLVIAGAVWGLGVGYQALSELQAEKLGSGYALTGLQDALLNEGVVVGEDID